MTARKLKSIAIIPDGNRRYARKRGASIAAAYARGFEKAREVIKWSGERADGSGGVSSLAFWALSLELREQGVSVRFFGKLAALPRDLRDALAKVEEATADNAARVVSVGLAYGGKEEVFEAARSFALDLRSGALKEKDLTPAAFQQRLWFPESPDLIIRTGRVQRLSGFLPLQAGYSELYFSPKLWPEFTRDDYAAAVEFFAQSEARYGK